MDRTKATAAFPKLFAEIQAVVFRHDPSGLFAMGAPKDEHDDAINRIISLLQYAKGPNDVQEVLKNVMGEWAAATGNDPNEVFQTMAAEIWTAWCSFREKAG